MVTMRVWFTPLVAHRAGRRSLNGDELDVVLPVLRGIVVGEAGAQRTAAFASPSLPQLLAIEGEARALLVDLDIETRR
jgi:hypothetical protein